MREYLLSKNISIYKLSKESHVPYSTLNDLVNQKLPVENIRSGQLRAIAKALQLDMDTLYDLCSVRMTVRSPHYDVSASVSIEHKSYFLNFERNKKFYKYKLSPVKQEATAYLEILAGWALDEILDKLILEESYETICS